MPLRGATMTSETGHHQTTPPSTIIPLDPERELKVALKHLEMIQDVKREAGRKSLVLRSSSILITSTIFVLAPEDANPIYFIVPIFPIMCFWTLDAYNIRQIRRLGEKYDEVREKYFLGEVLSMKYKMYLVESSDIWIDQLDEFNDEKTTFGEPELLVFYTPIIAFILFYFLYQTISSDIIMNMITDLYIAVTDFYNKYFN